MVAADDAPLPSVSLVSVVEYIPKLHATHSVAPESLLYFPASQETHDATEGAPLTLLYFPGSHFVHLPSVHEQYPEESSHSQSPYSPAKQIEESATTEAGL
eukprot:CAMPEP_0185791346 /NCGR_PEP_ID=MMETSP1174-20130828/158322_1 /TAXON_ID=35687 /ORGANISM="Dictyocha speculum, Strain CCMP1381" /LENGTH=100 /DNA_ID=CAMNT_0028486291 /DNA_START=2159 /DNA_END=2461 /DNA_ORIENTATION=-